jgi:signal transduction histidine kinase
VIWGILSLFIVFITSYFISRFVFTSIDRLHEKNLYRMRELAILSEVNQTVDEFHNMQALLNRAINKLIDITAADAGELYLVDEQSNELVHKLHGGYQDDVFKREMQLYLKEWLRDESDRLNKQVIVQNLNNLQDEPGTPLGNAGVRSLAIVPLQSRSGTIGVVCLFSQNHDHFIPNEANLLLIIGNRIAVAIENARLYEKVQAVAVLEERERISAELHDGLAQVLGYVITKSQATRELLRKMTEANDYLVELEDVAQELYTDTREAILGLRTAISGDRNMVSALTEYVTRFNQMHNIKTELTIDEHPIPSLSPPVELQVVRIVQEALSNVRKHAEATRATIKIIAGDEEITIAIKDNGKGFNTDKVGEVDWTKFGLKNMKERADSIHSNLFIESNPQSGTKVTLSIPLTSLPVSVKESG